VHDSAAQQVDVLQRIGGVNQATNVRREREERNAGMPAANQDSGSRGSGCVRCDGDARVSGRQGLNRSRFLNSMVMASFTLLALFGLS
jgi:hypothetical protein